MWNIHRNTEIKFPIIIAVLLVMCFFILSILDHIQTSINRSVSTTDSNAKSSIKTPAIASNTAVVPPSAVVSSTKVDPNPPIPVTQPLPNIGHVVGIAAGGLLPRMTVSDMNIALDDMVKLGVTWVRFDIEWGVVQYSSPNNSNWANYDAMVNAINAHHMKGLGIILFTPEWARNPKCTGGAKCPPNDPRQYAVFASQVVNRYKDQGMHYWEIWNEPNNYDFWATTTDCNAYTNLLKATYPLLKKVDPNSIILTGGLAPEATDKHNISRIDFLICIYKDGGKNYFDAVGDHPYTFPNFASKGDDNAWGQMSRSNPSMRSIMIANGDANKKIWLTEVGAPTNGPDSYWFVNENKQAQMITDLMSQYKTYDWAGPIFWYTLKDSGTSTNTIENFFGLIRLDGTFKPAYTTLKNYIYSGL